MQDPNPISMIHWARSNEHEPIRTIQEARSKSNHGKCKSLPENEPIERIIQLIHRQLPKSTINATSNLKNGYRILSEMQKNKNRKDNDLWLCPKRSGTYWKSPAVWKNLLRPFPMKSHENQWNPWKSVKKTAWEQDSVFIKMTEAFLTWTQEILWKLMKSFKMDEIASCGYRSNKSLFRGRTPFSSRCHKPLNLGPMKSHEKQWNLYNSIK